MDANLPKNPTGIWKYILGGLILCMIVSLVTSLNQTFYNIIWNPLEFLDAKLNTRFSFKTRLANPPGQPSSQTPAN